VVAWYNTHLLGLQKFIFSMAAGVGPVFILRWFWWRVNAWSQFSAMLSSLILAIGWDLLQDQQGAFFEFTEQGRLLLNMSPYAFKLIGLTFLVSTIWLVVTFLTPPDDHKTLEAFVRKVRPGGWWPGHPSRVMSRRNLVLLLIYPLVSILPFLMIWLFKFGSNLLAWSLLLVWLGIIILVLRAKITPGDT